MLPQRDHADLGLLPDRDRADLRPGQENAPGAAATASEGLQNTQPAFERKSRP